jgi:hypothetical protein
MQIGRAVDGVVVRAGIVAEPPALVGERRLHN